MKGFIMQTAVSAPTTEQHDLLTPIAPYVANGQERYRGTIRRLTQLVHPGLQALLDDCEGDPFLDPLAFLHFAFQDRSPGLEQTYLGYLVATHQPIEGDVTTDELGYAYIPRLGLLKTDYRDARLSLDATADGNVRLEVQGNRPVDFRFDPLTIIPGTTIELLRHQMPILRGCFVNERNEEVSVELDDIATDRLSSLSRAFSILQSVWPTLHVSVAQVVRTLVVFHSDELNSFAAPAAHGMAFLNAALGDDEVFFLEDLAHQCGHVLFSAATIDAPPYFLVNPATPISSFNRHEGDDRSVYVTLHGVFTESLMAQLLDACLTEEILAGKQRHELEGRLAFVMKRFASDLQNLVIPGILNERGEQFLHQMLTLYRDIAERRTALIVAADMSNQSYNFAYAPFAELNPISTRQHSPVTTP